jgi:hypothetical protein
VKRGGSVEWTQIDETRGHVSDALSAVEWFAPRLAKTGWIGASYIHYLSPRGATARLVAKRPCPDCKGTGRDIREAARLVLDATVADRQSPEFKNDRKGRAAAMNWTAAFARGGDFIERIHPGGGLDIHPNTIVVRLTSAGAKQARETLHVEADRRSEQGVERGDTFWNLSASEAEDGGRGFVRARGGGNVRVLRCERNASGTSVDLAWTEPDPLAPLLTHWLAGSREGTDTATADLMSIAWRAEIMHGEEPSRGVG